MSILTMGEALDLSANIRRYREMKGWSQRELARRLNTSHPVVVRWEQPVASITLESIIKLADVFGVSIRDMFSPPSDNRTGTTTRHFSFNITGGTE